MPAKEGGTKLDCQLRRGITTGTVVRPSPLS